MAASDDKRVDYARKLFEAADEMRVYFEDRWRELDRYYRNRNKPRRLRGQAEVYSIPDAFRVIETLTPHHILGMFRNDRWFSVEAPGAAGATYPQLCRSLLLYNWRRMRGYVKTMQAVKRGNIRGHALGKLYWRTEIGERQVMDVRIERDAEGNLVPKRKRVTVPHVRYNGPDLDVLDLFDVWKDPTGKNNYYIIQMPSSVSDLVEENKKFGGQLYKNLSKIKENIELSRAMRSYPSTGVDRFSRLAQEVDGVPEAARPEDHVTLWQFFGYVNPSVRRYEDVVDDAGNVVEKATQWRLWMIADREVLIRDEAIPAPDHRPSSMFIETPALDIEGQIYGDSLLSYIIGLSKMRSQLENDRMQEIKIQMFGTHAVDSRAEVDARKFKEPGGYIKITPPYGMNVGDVFREIPRSPILPEAYAESAVKERQILDTTGATEPFQGTFAAGGSHRTRGEFEGTVSLGSSRIQQNVWWWDETWKKPILEQSFKLNQVRLTTPEMIQLAGRPDIYGEVDLTDLQYDIDVWVDSGMFGSLDSAQFDRIVQSLQVFASNPEWAIHVDPRKLVDRITYRSGIAGMDDILRSQEDVAAIQQAQQDQQLLEAVLQGGQGAAQ